VATDSTGGGAPRGTPVRRPPAADHADVTTELRRRGVAQAGSDIDAEALRGAVADRVSSDKIPSVVVELDEHDVPRLTTGKPDKRPMRARFVGDAGVPEPS
jgi:acyl-CoA synthetase (AMP-forming)/AMP-acid ligase II